MAQKLFCFGYGYTCGYLGRMLRDIGGWEIAGTTRDPDKRDQMEKDGIEAWLFDYDTPLAEADKILSDVTHILISTPPDDFGDPAYLSHGKEIKRLKNLKWLGYLSTTGVYGDRGGEWVDETSEIRPSTKRGSRRARAEQQWLESYYDDGVPAHMFRLAGIYGPGRSAIDSVRAGSARRIEKPGHVFSRIHIEDILQVLYASMLRPNPGRFYNLSDDEAVPSHEVIAYACELLGLTPPPLIPFDQADLAPITLSFYSDNKRVRNDRIKNELGIELKYPTYREGLKACLDAASEA